MDGGGRGRGRGGGRGGGGKFVQNIVAKAILFH